MTLASPIAPAPDAAHSRRPAAVRWAWLFASLALLVVLILASVAFGAREVTFDDIIAGITGQAESLSALAVQQRVPRTVLAILVGAALAVAGATMQGITRNPLADPGILGISPGASLAVVIGIAYVGLYNPWAYIAFATVGAAVAAVFVYFVGSLGRGGATPLKLALSGAAATAAFLSLTSAIMLPRVDQLNNFRLWQVGGVGGVGWDQIAVVTPVLIAGGALCFAMARGMNMLALGDDLAAGLGERVGRTRLLCGIGAVILCGAATAVAGPIAFVGLVIPHLCRLLVGADYRWILLFSVVLGASLIVGADVVGRIITRPQEVEVGIITALIGAPFFVWIVRRTKVRDL
ncbi:FecCD family ABC transporter permease [Demequina sp.]|uniref:FecCD family ABC transporter permease n=1 Tax=Demequina sp. TaxID=2050685 RepID=UPI003D13511A